MRIIIALFLSVLALSSTAATVDTVDIYSSAMHKSSKCVVIIPAKAGKHKERLPAVYLLHGWSGNYNNWITRVTALRKYADEYRLLIVCPDGHYSSWYFDSPVDSTMRYETYITKEVVDYIDNHYPTVKDRKARAITGLSMGGHGGLYLGFRHADIFGGCGSMSGGVDLNSSRTVTI
jgi:S-formylglutathione hydrolase FrmB